MGIFLKEHFTYELTLEDGFDLIEDKKRKDFLLRKSLNEINHRNFKTERGKDYHCFTTKVVDDKLLLNTNYFVGLDWLTTDRYIHIEPKLNFRVAEIFKEASEVEKEDFSDDEIANFDNEARKELEESQDSFKEVNIIAMLMEVMSYSEVAKETDSLLLIDWEAPEIEIEQKQDLLTPFLVVKFLKLLQDIARKGLKKSYYKVQENLCNRIKGKILVGKQIKQNVFKNRFTNTVCEYQVFGEDSIENRFLKKVFLFCTQYVENNTYYFKSKNDISWMVNYIRPSFEHISSNVDIHDIKHLKYNPFFKEYKEAIKIGQQILKRFSYNITKTTTDEKIATPPFWIDMPKMFELYVYAKLLEDNPTLNHKNFNYQFSTHGNSLDFLICTDKEKIVVDTKYKLKYNYSQIHEDIRQVAGYARLNKVRDEVGLENSGEEIPCLIIYPKSAEIISDSKLEIDKLLDDQNKINAYHQVYKIGIDLPILK
ncbi:5-methylcytosine restriction system specificity protein McrC [Chryseobacterium caseinilyticum]|uniref:Restriction endonuclease n=1 Tax=Chryseobacterium caseinilyticum TaxID=2771428 RepID=A0ABR8Z6R2_9FLAO|nr:restriction endonuclease [Chryseobacterium caseinilyticum]MBD8080901.1 restriction endonuclease [Chryseobacterium caseinilyticum]